MSAAWIFRNVTIVACDRVISTSDGSQGRRSKRLARSACLSADLPLSGFVKLQEIACAILLVPRAQPQYYCIP